MSKLTEYIETNLFDEDDASVWEKRYRIISESLKKIEVANHDDEKTRKINNIKDSGIGRLEYERALSWEGRSSYYVYKHLLASFNALYTPAVYALNEIFNSASYDELLMDKEEYKKKALYWARLASELDWKEKETALLTGTLPVHFKLPDGGEWGEGSYKTGSLFFVEYYGRQFAITAKHVMSEYSKAEDFQLVLPESGERLPVIGGYCLDFESDDFEKDIYIWEVSNNPSFEKEVEWWAWNMEKFAKTASDLYKNHKIYAAGLPNLANEEIPYEGDEYIAYHFLVSGQLSDQFVEGLYLIDVDDKFARIDLNGMSGGPVFARFDELFYYVGLTVRASGKYGKINFVDSKHVIDLLDKVVSGEVESQI